METIILALFILFFSLERIVSCGLNELNIRHLLSHKSRAPEFFRNSIDDNTYSKSVAYTLDKGKMARWSLVYDTLITIWILFGGVLPWLEQWSGSYNFNSIITGICFIFGLGVISSLLGLPLEWISIFGIEQKHGFNKMTVRLYITDKIKGIFVSILISVPCLYIILWFMEASGTLWWIWVFGFIMAFQIIMLIIYPLLIAPLFNKFEPLEDGEFKQAIEELSNKVNFSLSGIFRMDGSKRSSHSNAYFTGIGKSRRIVLFDTLIKEMTVPQRIAVLAHEMGHYKLHHIKKMISISAISLFMGLFFLSFIYDYPPLFNVFGLTMPTNHGALVLFSLLSGTFTFYLKPLYSAFSRKHEYEADRFSVKNTGEKISMEDALLRLTKQNLSNLTPHPWYSAFYYSHPTLPERIQAIRAL
jgi:STE24 endopeptidase